MSRSRYALAGLVTGLAGIAVSHALTMLLAIRTTPIVAVAETIIVHTPGAVAEALISVVGKNDKPLLVTGVTLGLLALSVLAGLLARRHQVVAQVLFVVMGVIAFLAVQSRPGGSVFDVLPVVVGTATWLVVLPLLTDYLTRTRGADTDASRRGFLLRAGAVAAGALVVGVGGQFLGQARRGVESARRLLRLPVSAGSVPPGANVDVPGVEPWRTPNADFYRIDTALAVPTINPDEWRLRIHGMVDRELELSYRDLLDREMTEAWVTLCCVSNEVGGDLISNAYWSGVRIADLLAEAGVQPGADAVLQTSHDDWTCGTPLPALTDDRNAMLAIAMNGEPLPLEHGFPVRMVVPGLYGYVSATKWLVDLKVSRFEDFTAYWTDRGWSARGPVKTESRIDVPRPGAEVSAGVRRVGGSAWAQHTGIAKVEYRLDGDAWQEATLGTVPGADTWVQWAGEVEVAAGEHSLTVRATDKSGYTQTSVRRGVIPDGATGWHSVGFTAS